MCACPLPTSIQLFPEISSSHWTMGNCQHQLFLELSIKTVSLSLVLFMARLEKVALTGEVDCKVW